MTFFQQKLFRLFNLVLSGLFSILGFSGCEGESRVEYGSPNATFIVNGNISSAETGEPVNNIKVVMGVDDFYANDSTYTDASGFYEVSDNYGFPDDAEYLIRIRDIDGDVNGEYENVDTTVVFENPEFEGGDGSWNEGVTSKEFNIKLTPKK